MNEDGVARIVEQVRRWQLIQQLKQWLADEPTAPGGPDGDYRPKDRS